MVYEGVSRVKGTTRMVVHWRLNGRSLPLLGLKWQEEGSFQSLVRARTEEEMQCSCSQNCGEAERKPGEFRLQDLYLPHSKLMLLPPFGQR